MRELDTLFEALARSSFRRRFRINRAMRRYLADRSLATVLEHGRTFLDHRLVPARPENDGKQTPMRGHPIFIAQHATATCCRRCLEKWHGIGRGRQLTEDEVAYILQVIQRWLQGEADAASGPRQATFPWD